MQDAYSQSFISPNSAVNEIRNANEQQQQHEQYVDKTSGPSEIVRITSVGGTITPSSISGQFSVKKSKAIRTARSADPILSKTSGVDNLLAYKNIEESLDSNDVEMSARVDHLIQPSKTVQKLIFNETRAIIYILSFDKSVG